MCWLESRIFHGKVIIILANPFNLSQNTKNFWLSRMDDDLTVKNSALQPAHCIHLRLPDEDWIQPTEKGQYKFCRGGGGGGGSDRQTDTHTYNATLVKIWPKEEANYKFV